MSRDLLRSKQVSPPTQSKTAKQSVSQLELTAEAALRTPSTQIEPAVRGEMERKFGWDFSSVRVHANREATALAAQLGARAFTVGRDVAFAQEAYQPATPEGKRLLAHELSHVIQQSDIGAARIPTRVGEQKHETEATRAAASTGKTPLSRVSEPVVQRDDKPTSPGGPGTGGVLTVVIRAPDDKFTQNVTDYARKTLSDPSVMEVDNLDEVFVYLQNIKKSGGPKLKSIRIIGHGSNVGGIKMLPRGESKRRFVSPQELEKISEDKNLQSIASGAMESGATVEFWGCYVGREVTSQAALSRMFQSEFRSLEGELKTQHDTFEAGGKTITSSAQVDEAAKRNKHAKPQFEAWLLKKYAQLVADGDIAPQATREDRIKVMRELFDRSGGKIQQLIIQDGRETVRRGDKQNWMGKWRKWNVN